MKMIKTEMATLAFTDTWANVELGGGNYYGETGILVMIAVLGLMWILFLVSLECTEHPVSNWLNLFASFFLPIAETVFISFAVMSVADRYRGWAWIIPIIILIFNTSCMLIAVQKNRVRQIASLISLSLGSISMVGMFLTSCLVPYFMQTLTQYLRQ